MLILATECHNRSTWADLLTRAHEKKTDQACADADSGTAYPPLPYTVNDLNRLLGVSRRTVFRDLRLLDQSGIRYVYSPTTKGYSADPATVLPPITLSQLEAFELMLMARHTVAQHGLFSESAAASASRKLEAAIPPGIRDYCVRLLRYIEILPDAALDARPIDDATVLLQSALLDQRKVRAGYDSSPDGRLFETVLHPYRLVHIHRA